MKEMEKSEQLFIGTFHWENIEEATHRISHLEGSAHSSIGLLTTLSS